jgi:hypothetical protein
VDNIIIFLILMDFLFLILSFVSGIYLFHKYREKNRIYFLFPFNLISEKSSIRERKIFNTIKYCFIIITLFAVLLISVRISYTV